MPTTPFPAKAGSLANPSPSQYLSTQEADTNFDAVAAAISGKADASFVVAALAGKANAATTTAALAAKADSTALVAGLATKLNASEVVADPALPTGNDSKVLTQLAVKNHVAAQVGAVVAPPNYLTINANTTFSETNLKPGFLYTIRNSSASAITLIFSGTYAFYSVSKLDFVDTGGGLCQIPALTTVEVSVAGTQIFVRRKHPVSMGSRQANVSSILYQDSFITILWDSPNRQPTYIYNDSNLLGVQWLNRTVTCELIPGNLTNSNGTSNPRFSSGRDITTVAPGVARYFTRSGLIDTAFAMDNYGGRMTCSVIKEFYNASFPGYRLEIIMGSIAHIYYSVTTIRS